MKQEQYIRLAKRHLGKEADKYNNIQLSIIGKDQHRKSQEEIDKLFNIKKL